MDFMLFNEFLQYSNPVLIMKSTNYSNLNEEWFLNDPHSYHDFSTSSWIKSHFNASTENSNWCSFLMKNGLASILMVFMKDSWSTEFFPARARKDTPFFRLLLSGERGHAIPVSAKTQSDPVFSWNFLASAWARSWLTVEWRLPDVPRRSSWDARL